MLRFPGGAGTVQTMFYDDDESGDFEMDEGSIPDDVRAMLDDLGDSATRLADKTSRIGLHPLAHSVMVHEDSSAAVVMTFNVGDLAWSDRVQNPQQEDVNAEFRELVQAEEERKFEEMQQRLKDKYGKS